MSEPMKISFYTDVKYITIKIATPADTGLSKSYWGELRPSLPLEIEFSIYSPELQGKFYIRDYTGKFDRFNLGRRLRAEVTIISEECSNEVESNS